MRSAVDAKTAGIKRVDNIERDEDLCPLPYLGTRTASSHLQLINYVWNVNGINFVDGFCDGDER